MSSAANHIQAQREVSLKKQPIFSARMNCPDQRMVLQCATSKGELQKLAYEQCGLKSGDGFKLRMYSKDASGYAGQTIPMHLQ